MQGYRKVGRPSAPVQEPTGAGSKNPDFIVGVLGQHVYQGHRKVDEAVKILLTANLGEERLTMKSGFFEPAPVGS